MPGENENLYIPTPMENVYNAVCRERDQVSYQNMLCRGREAALSKRLETYKLRVALLTIALVLSTVSAVALLIAEAIR